MDYSYHITNGNVTIDYNVTPDYGTPIFRDQPVKVTGRVRHSSSTYASITVQLLRSGTICGSGTTTFDYRPPAGTYYSFSASVQGRAGTMTSRTNSLTLSFILNSSSGSSVGSASNASKYVIMIPEHFQPTINPDVSIERCNTSGTLDEAGTKLLVKKLKLGWNSSCGISSYSSITVHMARLYYASGGSVGSQNFSVSSSMTGSAGYSETTPSLFSSLTVNKSFAYRLELELGDAYETAKISIDLPLPTTIVDFGLNGGFAIGRYSTSTETNKKFEVAADHQSIFYGGIDGVTNYTTAITSAQGFWIDGKPIYRAVYHETTTRSTGTLHQITAFSDNIDTLISLRAYALIPGANDGNDFWRVAPSGDYRNLNYAIHLSLRPNGQIQFGIGTGYSSGKELVVIAEYTRA